MGRDGKRQLLFFGYKPELREIQQNAPNVFEREGLEMNWQATYANVGYDDIQSILSEEDLTKKSGEWLRDVRESNIRGILQSTDCGTPSISGWGVTLKPREYNRWRDVANIIVNSSTTKYNIVNTHPQKTPPNSNRTTNNPNAPFSYDPAQDYSTEPDR